MNTGMRTIALSRLVYHESMRALPLTTARLFLITTEWIAVIRDEATPNATPTVEGLTPSRNTPTKNPAVTREHARMILTEGVEWRKTRVATTVNGRTRPSATW